MRPKPSAERLRNGDRGQGEVSPDTSQNELLPTKEGILSKPYAIVSLGMDIIKRHKPKVNSNF